MTVTSHKSIVSFVAAGHTMPDEMIVKLLKANPSGIGYALRDAGDAHVAIERGQAELKDIKEIQEAFKAVDLYFSFMDYPKDSPESCLQPFVLFKDKKDQPTMVGFATGQFNNFIPDG